MNKAILFFLGLLLIAATVFSGACSSDDADVTGPGSQIRGGGTLSLLSTEPVTLDPATMRESISASYILEIFSGLVSLNTELEVVGDIASDWDISEDGRTYTFHLREDVRFHDGKPVTSADVKYSLERACDPVTGSETAANFLGDIVGVAGKLAGTASEISGVKVIDDYTLALTIDSPKAHFLAKLVHPVAFVVDRRNVAEGGQWWREPTGSGPFRLDHWDEDEELFLKRNDAYYGQLPRVENVVFRFLAGMPMAMYEDGEIDITAVSSADIERVLDPANPLHEELVVVEEFSLWYIGFNSTQPPFDDPMVRQAFSHAVDKEKIIRLVLKNMASEAEGILPLGMPGYNEDLTGLEFDPEKAKALLAQSPYPDLSSVTLTASGRGNVSPINEALIDMWRWNLGVQVSIRQIEPETYFQVVEEEKDDLFEAGWIADYPDPQNFLDVLFHSQSAENTGEYHNPEVDRLLEAAREELDAGARIAMYQEIEQLVVDDAAYLPLFFSNTYFLVKPHVKGFVAAPLPIPWLKYIYIDEGASLDTSPLMARQ